MTQMKSKRIDKRPLFFMKSLGMFGICRAKDQTKSRLDINILRARKDKLNIPMQSPHILSLTNTM